MKRHPWINKLIILFSALHWNYFFVSEIQVKALQ